MTTLRRTLQFAGALLLIVVFFVARVREGHFGTWSSVACFLMFGVGGPLMGLALRGNPRPEDKIDRY